MNTDSQPNTAEQAGANTQGNNGDTLKYWCHMCNKVVDVPSTQEAVDGEIHCSQCGDSFVELYEGPGEDNTDTNITSEGSGGAAAPTAPTGPAAPLPNPTTVTPLTQLLQNLTNSLVATMPQGGASHQQHVPAGGSGPGEGQNTTGDQGGAGDEEWETASEEGESSSQYDSDDYESEVEYEQTYEDYLEHLDGMGLGNGPQGYGAGNPFGQILQMLTGGPAGAGAGGINLQFGMGPQGLTFNAGTNPAGAAAAGGGGQVFDPFAALLNLSTQQFPGMAGQGVNMGDYYHGPGFEQFISQFIDHENPFGTPPTDPAYLESMKEETLSADQLKDAPECHVCMDTFTAEDKVYTLPCEHTFHTSCLSPWLKDHSNCPNCRYQLPWQGMPRS